MSDASPRLTFARKPGHDGADQHCGGQPAGHDVREVPVRRIGHGPHVVVQHEAGYPGADHRQHRFESGSAGEPAYRGDVRQHVHDQQGEHAQGGQVEEHVERRHVGQPEAGQQHESDEHLQREGARRHAGAWRHVAEAAGPETVPPEREHHPGGDGEAAKAGAHRAEHRPRVE